MRTKEEIMAIDTHEVVAGGASFAARVYSDQVPLLLVALKQWREIRRGIQEEDAAMRQAPGGEVPPVESMAFGFSIHRSA